jgi:hypothetical protein
LEDKATEFGDDPHETYLRITLGHSLGKSPGIPYVLEIWPTSNYSPIHNHGNIIFAQVNYFDWFSFGILCMFIVNIDTYRTMQNFNNGVCVSMVMYWTVIARWPNFQNIWNSRGLSMITAQRFSATITTVVTPHTGHILITLAQMKQLQNSFRILISDFSTESLRSNHR